MQGCQCRRAGQTFPHTVIYTVHLITQPVDGITANLAYRIIQLIHIDCIGPILTGRHIGNLLAACIDATRRYTGAICNCKTSIRYRCVLCFTANSQAA